jgi:hypothetical protein
MARNPLYDPGWHGRLMAAEAALAAARADEAAAAGAFFAGPAHRAALARLDAARAERQAAWRTQFSTIAAYAAWRFGTLEEGKDLFALAQDPASFTSLEAVDAAYEHALRDAREGMLESRFRLEVGQPVALAAFAPGAGTISSWRLFGEIDCMVSFCLAEQNFHICLAHPWGGLAAQKSNEMFRAIATQLARETILLQAPETAPVFNDGGHRLAQNREAIRAVNALAAKFRFYRHLLPERNLREEFCAVSMTWNGAGWIDPDWEAHVFDRLPESLRDASGQPALPALSARV